MGGQKLVPSGRLPNDVSQIAATRPDVRIVPAVRKHTATTLAAPRLQCLQAVVCMREIVMRMHTSSALPAPLYRERLVSL